MKHALIFILAVLIVFISVAVTDSVTEERYNFIPLLIVILACYAVTWFASNKGKISILTHRRIWNSVLLVSFLMTAILGLLLIIRLNYGITVELPFRHLYWHVETGIVMSITVVFHFTWYWRFFASMLKREKKD